MSFGNLQIISSVVFGLSVLSVGGPVLGEVMATMAPAFPKAAVLSAQELGLPYEEVAFITGDGIALRGWFFPAEDPDSPAMLYAPSASHDQRSGLSLVAPFHQAGYHVLLFSYRGHGQSQGNRFGFTYGAMESLDVDAAVRFLYESKQIRRIGAIGHSAGAVSIILSAARNPHISAVVAASPYRTMQEVWNTSRPALIPAPFLDLVLRLSEALKGFSRDQVRPREVIAQISPRPLLLVHGSGDERITQRQAMLLFAAAEEPKRMWLVEGADHAQMRSPVLDELAPNLIAFLDQALRRPAVESGANRNGEGGAEPCDGG